MAEVKNHPIEDVGEQMEVRRRKLAEFKGAGQTVYPNDFRPTHTASVVVSQFGGLADEELGTAGGDIKLAGRIMGIRSFGKASFFHLQDRRGRLQVYVRRDRVGDDGYALFQQLDAGDIVGVRGRLFRTKTKEWTLEARGVRLLCKCLRPLPEKWHGLARSEERRV